jgi:pimeloyl-ACP methyl ester carboxylesterase
MRASALRVALAISIIGLAAQASAADASPPLHRCELGPARPYRCGHIEVPAVRGEPGLGTQKIRFALRPRGDRARRSLGTIVAVEGGPGFASTNFDSAKSFGAAFGPLLRRRELVLIDQRGTGASQTVLCGGLQTGRVPELIAVGECANQLGPRAQGFSSAESAADIEAVRQALGLRHVVLYGDSYGTLLGQAYAVRYGANLDGLVLSSAYPADDPFWRTLYPAGVRALRIQCNLATWCDGNGAARFRRVMRRLQASGSGADDLLFFLLENGGTWAPISYRHLNRADIAFLHGHRRPLRRLIARGPPGQGDPGYYSAGMAEAVECNDYPVAWDRSLPYQQRLAQLDDAIARFPHPHAFAPLTVREWMMSPSSDLVSCLAWPPPSAPLDPPVPAGASMPAELPTLVLAGELDDITSVAEARTVAARFPASSLYVVPNRGHVSELYFPFVSPATARMRRFIRAH